MTFSPHWPNVPTSLHPYWQAVVCMVEQNAPENCCFVLISSSPSSFGHGKGILPSERLILLWPWVNRCAESARCSQWYLLTCLLLGQTSTSLRIVGVVIHEFGYQLSSLTCTVVHLCVRTWRLALLGRSIRGPLNSNIDSTVGFSTSVLAINSRIAATAAILIEISTFSAKEISFHSGGA